MVTPLENAIGFLQNFGLFDVVLPFLLVFTIVFAVLEKSKIFGTEKVDEREVTKKNINSMVAFVIALFVVVTKQIVSSLQQALPQIVLVLVVIVSFMLLAGTFVSGREPYEVKGMALKILSVIAGVAVLGIIFNSIGWLEPILDFIKTRGINDIFIVSIIFLIIVVITIAIVVSGPKEI